MADKIDSALQGRFFDMCDGFCKSNAAESKTAEVLARKAFILNLYYYLSSIDSSLSGYGSTMNYIYGKVVDGSILLTDMMSYFGSAAPTADTFKEFLDSYSSDGDTRKSEALRQIETEMLLSGESAETSVGDIISADGLFSFETADPTGLLASPIVGTEYSASQSCFMTYVDAMIDFESKRKAYIAANPGCLTKIAFDDLESLRDDAFGSSDSTPRTGLLWKYGGSKDLPMLSWLKKMSFSGSDETIESLCESKLAISEYEWSFEGLAKMIYSAYAVKTQQYEYRNSEFILSVCLGWILDGSGNVSISHENITKYMLLCLVCEKNLKNLSPYSSRITEIEGKIFAYKKAAAALEGHLDGMRSSFGSDSGKYSLR